MRKTSFWFHSSDTKTIYRGNGYVLPFRERLPFQAAAASALSFAVITACF